MFNVSQFFVYVLFDMCVFFCLLPRYIDYFLKNYLQ